MNKQSDLDRLKELSNMTEQDREEYFKNAFKPSEIKRIEPKRSPQFIHINATDEFKSSKKSMKALSKLIKLVNKKFKKDEH